MTQLDLISTCGPACWNATSERCTCSCGGRYHGRLYHGSAICRQMEAHYEGNLGRYLKAVESFKPHPDRL